MSQFSPRLVEKGMAINQSKKEKFMIDYIRNVFPQLSLKNSKMSLEEIYNAIIEGRVILPKVQDVQREPMFQEIEYYVKINEAYQSGKKLSKENLMDLFKFEVQQLTPCEKKIVLQELALEKEVREAIRN